MNVFKEALRYSLKTFGIKVEWITLLNDRARFRSSVREHHDINVLIDVGANVGNYSQEARRCGFRGDIIAVEPLIEAYSKLRKKFANDSKFNGFNCAVGAENKEGSLYVSHANAASSMLSVTDLNTRVAPGARVIRTDRIGVRTIDDILTGRPSAQRYYLKIDVQGAERDVLVGAMHSLLQICAIELEVSLQELYKGSWLWTEAINWLNDNGYQVIRVDPGYTDLRTGRTYQLDLIAVRE